MIRIAGIAGDKTDIVQVYAELDKLNGRTASVTIAQGIWTVCDVQEHQRNVVEKILRNHGFTVVDPLEEAPLGMGAA